MPKDTPHILRAMSLNIWNYNPPWPRRRELIVRAVRETDPDIIGFQEIRHDGARNDAGRNQAEQLAERLPDYRFVYRPAQRDPEDGRWEGLAVFSRLPFRSSSHIELSRDASDGRDNHQRIVLHAEIETPAGPLHFFNTHLRPGVFPMDEVIFTGRMTEAHFLHERAREREEMTEEEWKAAQTKPLPKWQRRLYYFAGYFFLSVGTLLLVLIVLGALS